MPEFRSTDNPVRSPLIVLAEPYARLKIVPEVWEALISTVLPEVAEDVIYKAVPEVREEALKT